MVCKNCGKELIKVGELTENEIEELILINKKFVNANQALNPDVINKMEFSDNQVFEYFRAAYNNKAEAEFLNYIFLRKLSQRLNINTDKINISNNEPNNFDIFVHKE